MSNFQYILYAAVTFGGCIAACPALASDVFAPANCDFSVSFPMQPETRDLIAPNGDKAILAKSPNGQPLKLSAECWPLQSVSTADYAASISKKLGERGFTVHSTSIAKGAVGDIVTVAGVAGEVPNKYHFRFESFFGPRSRMDMLIMEKSAYPSVGNLDFRNSVRYKGNSR